VQQHAASGDQQSVELGENQKLLILQIFGLFKAWKFENSG
jgi:hypothetical protein